MSGKPDVYEIQLASLHTVSTVNLHVHRFTVKTDQHYDAFLTAVAGRPKEQPMITVSNHTCPVDDPMVLSAMLPWSLAAFRPEQMRWSDTSLLLY